MRGHVLTPHSLYPGREELITRSAVKAIGGNLRELKDKQLEITRHEAVSGSVLFTNAAFVLGYLVAAALFAKSQPL